MEKWASVNLDKVCAKSREFGEQHEDFARELLVVVVSNYREKTSKGTGSQNSRGLTYGRTWRSLAEEAIEW